MLNFSWLIQGFLDFLGWFVICNFFWNIFTILLFLVKSHELWAYWWFFFLFLLENFWNNIYLLVILNFWSRFRALLKWLLFTHPILLQVKRFFYLFYNRFWSFFLFFWLIFYFLYLILLLLCLIIPNSFRIFSTLLLFCWFLLLFHKIRFHEIDIIIIYNNFIDLCLIKGRLFFRWVCSNCLLFICLLNHRFF